MKVNAPQHTTIFQIFASKVDFGCYLQVTNEGGL